MKKNNFLKFTFKFFSTFIIVCGTFISFVNIAEALCLPIDAGKNPACDVSGANKCYNGTAYNMTNSGRTYSWYCRNSCYLNVGPCTYTGTGGTVVSPIDGGGSEAGVCGKTLNTCDVGDSHNRYEEAQRYVWECIVGGNWRERAGCSLLKPPVVTSSVWTDNGGSNGSAYYGEAAEVRFGTNNSVTSCSIYKNGKLIGPVSGNGFYGYGITGVYTTEPLKEGNTTYRVDCSNEGGTGTGNTVTFTVPTSPSGLAVNCPTPGTTANFSWTLPSGYAHSYFRYCKGSSCDYTIACSPAKNPPEGACVNFLGTSTAQPTIGNNIYSWYVHTMDANGNWSNAVSGSNVFCTPPPPNAPTVSDPTPNPASVGANVTFSVSAMDPIGQNVRYEFDFINNDGIMDGNSSYGASGWSFNAANSWSSVGTKTFGVRACASGGRCSGWVTKTVNVTQSACVPTINWINTDGTNPASKNPMKYNSTTTVSWNATGASSGVLTMDGVVIRNGITGSEIISPLKKDTVFRNTCTNAAGQTNYIEETIKIRPGIFPKVVDIGASCGDTRTISWTTENATSCSVKKEGVAWQTGLNNPGIQAGVQNTREMAFEFNCMSPTNLPGSIWMYIYVPQLNGACGLTPFSCAKGTSVNNASTTSNFTWGCNGGCGGTNTTCSQVKPSKINGACNTTHFSCAAGTSVNNIGTIPDKWTWSCNGIGGGTNASCTELKPINGACGATHYSCTSGTSANNASAIPGKWTWDCNGLNGGVKIACEETKLAPNAPTITGPVVGKVNTNYDFVIKATHPSGYPILYAIDSDNNDTVDEYIPVSGSVVSGTPVTWKNQWAGVGVKTFKVKSSMVGSGMPFSVWTTHSITLNALPSVVWAPSSANIPYGGRTNLSYTATNASYCDLYSTEDGNINKWQASPYWTNAPSTFTWTNQGPYTEGFKRKAVCYNGIGESSETEFRVDVMQNKASCGTINVLNYIVPGESFSPVITMKNVGDNVWTDGAILKHKLYTDDTTWGSQYLSLLNGPINKGATGSFSGSLNAPMVEGKYPFIWKAAESLDPSGLSVFGPPCSVTTENSNMIVVKNPTLGIGTTDVDIDTITFPSGYVINDPAIYRTLVIRNRGGGNLEGTINIPSGKFTCTSNCNFNIGPGGYHNATISFESSEKGSFGEVVTVKADSDKQIKTVSLTVVTGDKFTVTDNPLNFGDVAATRSKVLTLTIKNNSVVQSGGTFGISVAAPFSCVSGCGVAPLPASQSRTIRLKYTPPVASETLITQEVNLLSNPNMTIILEGRGVKPEFKINEL